MKGLLRNGLVVIMVMVVCSILLVPAAVVQAGEEDIPRIFSVQPGVPTPDVVIK